ncbi:MULTISPECIES: osmoprotectant ABC transporter substrate-binding protein [Streptococcus]|uniref:Glycine betaine/carnitine/choline/choline sulfate ABC transporter (Osmoprotectant-binding lipoprotein) n=1 Tax=Streptococcus thermophilus TaxID=1308 RepID=A0A8D6U4Q6_STRTR|nr:MULTISPECIES: osmoprotectant ABC transporter substrate-binding protein [Streptococcus]CCF01616.1 Osmotically activated L-carnitine/choline ABC transporter, substrate-binding protein OpuCC [Streptococcus macedonicus ACA-DC 198]PHV59193.1 osmoprotectant ABC transporter substrate-binding protein [Streptococcus macedonicus]CAD0139584.1 glycine betaine/carnitine/choline/choline sulfate ABC transporter (osmoprotectant-binding lipoprotein) [Streptococcus thermophilus]CAD0145015.1 glycine betaine/ca
MKHIKTILIGAISIGVLLWGYFTIIPPKTENNQIVVAGGITSEYQTLGSMVADMVTHYTGRDTRVLNNLATVTINHQAMLDGDAQISAARYTGTDLTTTLGLPAESDPKKAWNIVHDEFEKKFNQTWMPTYGFANSYVYLVRKDTAKKYNLKKISDMEKYKDKLTVGVDTAWRTREGDGYEGFKKAYGFGFDNLHTMQIGLVYTAVAEKKMDVVLGYTTDGRISSYDLVMLEDDKHFFPAYDACAVVDNKLLEQEPEVKKALEKLTNTIDTKEMQKLNYEADNNLKEPSVVAREFLEKHNYFEDKEVK